MQKGWSQKTSRSQSSRKKKGKLTVGWSNQLHLFGKTFADIYFLKGKGENRPNQASWERKKPMAVSCRNKVIEFYL